MPITTKDIILNFIAGGVVVAGTAYLATKVSRKGAALFWALPLTLMPILVFLYYKKASQRDITDFVGRLVPSLIIFIIYIVVLWAALRKTTFWKALAVGAVAFLIMAALFWVLVPPGGKIEID